MTPNETIAQLVATTGPQNMEWIKRICLDPSGIQITEPIEGGWMATLVKSFYDRSGLTEPVEAEGWEAICIYANIPATEEEPNWMTEFFEYYRALANQTGLANRK